MSHRHEMFLIVFGLVILFGLLFFLVLYLSDVWAVKRGRGGHDDGMDGY